MLCPICIKDFSDNVFQHHIARCAERQAEAAKMEPKPVSKMTLPELKQYAEAKGIDLADAAKKDEILAIILVAEEAGEAPPKDLDDDGAE